MATAKNAATAAVSDPELWRDQQRFYNFLQHYDLHKYHQRFLRMGVTRLSHFKDVTDADLDAVGLTRPEKTRLRKKLEQNFSTKGKLKKAIVRKGKLFDAGPSGDQVHQPRPLPDPTTQGASLIAREDIKLDKKIGEGAHGTVFEGTWSNVHGSVVVAVKTLYGKDEVHGKFIKEADSMRALLHQHIIQLYGIVLSTPLMLIQELAPCGNLHSFLEQNGATKNIGLFHTYAVQIADAMKYLEEKRIVHRDLATRNILLAAEDFLKLSDFGMARILDEQTGVYNLSNLQSRIPIAWTSIEALQSAKFSSASDVWSYAVTLWEIFSLGVIPWKGLTPIEIRDCLAGGERLGRPERCPREMYQVMTSCWEERPQDRPTFAGLFQTLQRSPPPKVRALKAHTVAADDDNRCLSFQKGDLIFLINKPKQDWLYGMLVDGKIGYFLEDHVTDIIDPIGDIKGKIQAGKVKVKDLPISGPTLVDHELHWGKNGERWGKTEEELRSTQPRTRSPLLPGSPPYRVVNSSPSQSPAPKTRSPTDSGSDVSSPRLMSPTNQAVPSAYLTAPGQNLAGPNGNAMSQEHNQYVTMRRGATMLPEDEEEEEQEEYVDMNPNRIGIKPQRMYENIRRIGDADTLQDYYSVPRSRNNLFSDSSSSDGDLSQQGSETRINQVQLPPRGEPNIRNTDELRLRELRTRTLPAVSSRLPSQYSVASQVSGEFQPKSPTDAISPTNVRYIPNPALQTAVGDPRSGSKFHASLGDVRPTGAPEAGTGVLQGLNQSPVRPRPKPRRGAAEVQRSASVVSPTVLGRYPRKSSLPEASYINLDVDQPLLEAVQGISLHSPHNGAQALVPDHTEPLIPIAMPEVPDRTHVPTTTQHKDSNTRATNKSSTSADYMNSLVAEFPDAEPELCQRALRSHGYDVNRAREEIQIQILLGMRMPNTNAIDCRRALKHCQWKIDRAASWLVERSLELEQRRT